MVDEGLTLATNLVLGVSGHDFYVVCEKNIKEDAGIFVYVFAFIHFKRHYPIYIFGIYVDEIIRNNDGV